MKKFQDFYNKNEKSVDHDDDLIEKIVTEYRNADTNSDPDCVKEKEDPENYVPRNSYSLNYVFTCDHRTYIGQGWQTRPVKQFIVAAAAIKIEEEVGKEPVSYKHSAGKFKTIAKCLKDKLPIVLHRFFWRRTKCTVKLFEAVLLHLAAYDLKLSYNSEDSNLMNARVEKPNLKEIFKNEVFPKDALLALQVFAVKKLLESGSESISSDYINKIYSVEIENMVKHVKGITTDIQLENTLFEESDLNLQNRWILAKLTELTKGVKSNKDKTALAHGTHVINAAIFNSYRDPSSAEIDRSQFAYFYTRYSQDAYGKNLGNLLKIKPKSITSQLEKELIEDFNDLENGRNVARSNLRYLLFSICERFPEGRITPDYNYRLSIAEWLRELVEHIESNKLRLSKAITDSFDFKNTINGFNPKLYEKNNPNGDEYETIQHSFIDHFFNGVKASRLSRCRKGTPRTVIRERRRLYTNIVGALVPNYPFQTVENFLSTRRILGIIDQEYTAHYTDDYDGISSEERIAFTINKLTRWLKLKLIPEGDGFISIQEIETRATKKFFDTEDQLGKFPAKNKLSPLVKTIFPSIERHQEVHNGPKGFKGLRWRRN